MSQVVPSPHDEEELRRELTSISLPPSRYPTGWFQIGWSDEVAAGEVKLVHYFGTQIVLWRGADGQLHASHPTCMHLGGNLGVKGTVHGDRIVCPWHGWEWNPDGTNALIPHSSQTCKPRLKLQKIWHVREWYGGSILVWHDLMNRDPLWDVPVIDELDNGNYYPFGPHSRTSWTIKAHPQMVMENGVDAFHIPYIHGAGEVPRIVSAGPTSAGHIWESVVSTSYGAGKKKTWLTPTGQIELTLSFLLWGVGLGLANWPIELFAARMITNPTPIDDTHSELFWCMTTDKGDDTGDQPNEFSAKFVEHQRKTVTQDFFTWANMEVLHPPNFAPEEGKHYAALRRWAWQFYPDLQKPQRIPDATRDTRGGNGEV
ncbi:Rieske 2Fe-2S domain-containing protein [Mycolicibacterium austroafricanum]|uniref:Rieske 2Fe-2S domain-containing protein n=1 Tax=Mycolicibacterium austroafricanum TaxID=39687 RepID=UPI001CA30B9A|nr:Rieske 2Fe-2S domain-containing protein [Mycolicibacterium austroafricanum]QZT58560.1 aromatic ring-hydroxylating dioxygenase subunit alpha [Mycolicibacterium austroafricanum]